MLRWRVESAAKYTTKSMKIGRYCTKHVSHIVTSNKYKSKL